LLGEGRGGARLCSREEVRICPRFYPGGVGG
jgi:hypothetical protein